MFLLRILHTIEATGCDKICPVNNIKEVLNKPKSYACYNIDEEIRKNSSSGGIFTLLADYILDNNGIVYGASFNNEWEVEHIRIDNKKDLEKLRTSKYLQSNINDIFQLAKQDLDNGVYVLFTGTPCQVNGFISYLNGKEYNKLYTQDIICHGVPSPKVWKKYLSYRKRLDGESPIQINFRHKYYGWNLFNMLLQYNNKSYQNKHDEDLFMQAFLRNVCLRDSCYNCSFKSKNRKVDITLADFWGITNVVPEFNDDKGISLVIVNTKKGQELFNKIQDRTVCKETNFEESIKYNPSMDKSANEPVGRKEFFENLNNMEFDKLVEKYTIKPKKCNLIKRALKKIKKTFLDIINKK